MEMFFEALRYKPDGRGLDFRLYDLNFSMTQSFRPHCGLWVDSVSNRNEYQEYILDDKGGRCVGLTPLPLSCSSILQSWSLNHLEPSGTAQACTMIKKIPNRNCHAPQICFLTMYFFKLDECMGTKPSLG